MDIDIDDVSCTSKRDQKFDSVVGHIEDIVIGMLSNMFFQRTWFFSYSCSSLSDALILFLLLFFCSTGDDFQNLQESFMEKYYSEFEDTEENKFIYTDIFTEYVGWNLLDITNAINCSYFSHTVVFGKESLF